MLQNIFLQNNIVKERLIKNITKQSFNALNRRKYSNLNNRFHFNFNEQNKNSINSYSKYKYNNNVILKRYISETNDIEKNNKSLSKNTSNNIEEPEKKVYNNIEKEQSSNKDYNNKNNTKQKSNWVKITCALLGGVGIGYSLNYCLNNKDKLNDNNDLLESFRNETLGKKINKFDISDYHHESISTKINIREDPNGTDGKNDVTVDIKIKEKSPGKDLSITKINYDSKKDSNNTIIETDKSAEELKKEIKTIQNESNSFMKNINDTINYFGSFFGFGNKESESMSEFDKEVEEAYMDIINNINKAPSEIRINNLRNNESININAESVNNEESIKEIEEKLKSWGDEMAREKQVKPAKSEIKNDKADMVINNNIDPKENNNKIVDFVNDMVKITDDTESNKKIIKVSAKPIAKAFHEASKISGNLEKNKDNLPEFLADCIKDTTDIIKNLSNDNVDIQNIFLDTVKIFSDSMNAISDYLDQLEIEIKTELNDNNDQNENKY